MREVTPSPFGVRVLLRAAADPTRARCVGAAAALVARIFPFLHVAAEIVNLRVRSGSVGDDTGWKTLDGRSASLCGVASTAVVVIPIGIALGSTKGAGVEPLAFAGSGKRPVVVGPTADAAAQSLAVGGAERESVAPIHAGNRLVSGTDAALDSGITEPAR